MVTQILSYKNPDLGSHLAFPDRLQLNEAFNLLLRHIQLCFTNNLVPLHEKGWANPTHWLAGLRTAPIKEP